MNDERITRQNDRGTDECDDAASGPFVWWQRRLLYVG